MKKTLTAFTLFAISFSAHLSWAQGHNEAGQALRCNYTTAGDWRSVPSACFYKEIPLKYGNYQDTRVQLKAPIANGTRTLDVGAYAGVASGKIGLNLSDSQSRLMTNTLFPEDNILATTVRTDNGADQFGLGSVNVSCSIVPLSEVQKRKDGDMPFFLEGKCQAQ